jgi:hypothetical protein
MPTSHLKVIFSIHLLEYEFLDILLPYCIIKFDTNLLK